MLIFAVVCLVDEEAETTAPSAGPSLVALQAPLPSLRQVAAGVPVPLVRTRTVTRPVPDMLHEGLGLAEPTLVADAVLAMRLGVCELDPVPDPLWVRLLSDGELVIDTVTLLEADRVVTIALAHRASFDLTNTPSEMRQADPISTACSAHDVALGPQSIL